MILFILIAAHFLADFTFQPSALAKRKAESFKFLLLHSLIYAAVIAVAGFFSVKVRAMLLPLAIIAVSHFVLDFLRLKVDCKFKNSGVQFWSFVLDQLLHVAVIGIIYFGFELGDYMTSILRTAIIQWAVRELIVCGLIFVVIWDPASVFVRRLFAYLAGSAEAITTDDEPRTGSLIGKLERLIIAVLVMFNQLGGIGFVLTAKSIARFKQFEEQGFAEKYLVGTLASTSIAIVVSFVLRRFL